MLIEHLEGPTLRRLIRKGGPLGLEQVLPLAAHVAAALHYMHEEGWVHLDTKPDNIVMGVPPRLIDLSIACTLEEAARITGSIGTDAYMPPEQCAPERFPGEIGPPRTCGAWGRRSTTRSRAAGRSRGPKGAGDSDDREVRFPQLVHEPEYLVDAPTALRELIEAMLSRDPAERPTAADAALALQPLVAALPRKLSFGRMGTRLR